MSTSTSTRKRSSSDRDRDDEKRYKHDSRDRNRDRDYRDRDRDRERDDRRGRDGDSKGHHHGERSSRDRKDSSHPHKEPPAKNPLQPSSTNSTSTPSLKAAPVPHKPSFTPPVPTTPVSTPAATPPSTPLPSPSLTSTATGAPPVPNVKVLLASIQAAKEKAAKELEEAKRKNEEKANPIHQSAPASISSMAIDSSSTTTTTTTSTSSVDVDIPSSKFYDPRLPMPKPSRKGRAFHFVEEGTFVKLAERMRQRSTTRELEDIIKRDRSSGASPSMLQGEEVDVETGVIKAEGGITVRNLKQELEEIPGIEWWDAVILGQERITSYPDDMAGAELADDHWIYVEHPVPIHPPGYNGPPPPLSLMLTKEEKKKLRKRNRMDAQKDKQDRILLGIDPPAPAKVKISNLYRVLTAQAVADPTQIEKEVRRQISQRVMNHEARNHSRMVAPEDRKAKEWEKKKADREKGLTCAIFRVRDLRNKPFRIKLDRNAQDNLITGAVLMYPAKKINLVIAEGGAKAIKLYKKLMLKRIDWANPLQSKDGDGEEAGTGYVEDDEPNKCQLVWEGAIIKANFRHFVFQACPTEVAARKFLSDHNAEHYWDMAKNHHDAIEDLLL